MGCHGITGKWVIRELRKKKKYMYIPLPPIPLQTPHWLFLRWKGHCLKHNNDKKLQQKQNNNTHVKKSLFQNFSLLIFSIRCLMLIFSSSRYGWASWKWSSSDHALYFYEPGALSVPGRFHSHRHWQIPPPWTNAWGQLSVQGMKLLELISPTFQTLFIFGQRRKLPSLIVHWEMLQTFVIEVQKWWK